MDYRPLPTSAQTEVCDCSRARRRLHAHLQRWLESLPPLDGPDADELEALFRAACDLVNRLSERNVDRLVDHYRPPRIPNSVLLLLLVVLLGGASVLVLLLFR